MLAPPADAPVAPRPASPEDLVTVVVADDDARYRDGVVRALGRTEGVSVVAAAADGRHALRLARELHPDVLLLDERMPGLTGTEIARRVHDDWGLVGVRVVVMSADGDAALSRRARSAGVVTWIDKARSRREIAAAVRSAGR